MWSRSNRSSMGSNVTTVGAQGGGNKKAGFPFQVGRDSWTSIAFNMTDVAGGKCAKLSCLMTTKFPLARVSRPIGGDVRTLYFNKGLPGRA
jgi:hypothetical protein